MHALIAQERKAFHKQLLDTETLTLTADGIVSNADKSSKLSKQIAQEIIRLIGQNDGLDICLTKKIAGQTLGKQFEFCVTGFLQKTFPFLSNLRHGYWKIFQLGNNNRLKTSDFAQYEHLAYLSRLTAADSQLAASLGNDYLIAPDIVIYRELCEDSEINVNLEIVDQYTCTMADLRKANGGKPILHASISAKFTMRSDRAQNSRTEALNLIRNRKGRVPHIAVVTAEPMPNRLASLALGTGDIDCVYHFALYELEQSVHKFGSEDSVDLLKALISGRRLKDISDLPLDLAV